MPAMSAGIIISIIVSLALLFAIRRAGVIVMSALDRLTASVSDATVALTDAAHRANAGNPTEADAAALGSLADALDAAVNVYRTATAPKSDPAPEQGVSDTSGSGNPLDPAAN
jgi:hypothetical protein